MIESKRIERKVKKQETKIHSHDAFNEPTLGMQSDYLKITGPMPNDPQEQKEYVQDLQKKNQELNDLIARQKMMLDEARAGGVDKTNCCAIF